MTIGLKIPTEPTKYIPQELAIQQEQRKFQSAYIFVNTDFKRRGEPVFVLACSEYARRVEFDRKLLYFKSDDEILEIISIIVKEHFISNNAKVPLWGNILSYTYYNQEAETYLFSTNGSYEKKDVEEAQRATVSIGGKRIC